MDLFNLKKLALLKQQVANLQNENKNVLRVCNRAMNQKLVLEQQLTEYFRQRYKMKYFKYEAPFSDAVYMRIIDIMVSYQEPDMKPMCITYESSDDAKAEPQVLRLAPQDLKYLSLIPKKAYREAGRSNEKGGEA